MNVTPEDLQKQLKEVCVQITHEAKDPRLTNAEVYEYLTVVNSAAQISMGLNHRIARVGLDEATNDIFRFVDVAVGKILKIRRALEQRESEPDPLEGAWENEGDDD